MVGAEGLAAVGAHEGLLVVVDHGVLLQALLAVRLEVARLPRALEVQGRLASHGADPMGDIFTLLNSDSSHSKFEFY